MGFKRSFETKVEIKPISINEILYLKKLLSLFDNTKFVKSEPMAKSHEFRYMQFQGKISKEDKSFINQKYKEKFGTDIKLYYISNQTFNIEKK